MRLRYLGLSWLGGLAGALMAMPDATAAEQIVMKYGALERSISVAELSQFARTGELSPELRVYLRMARQDPEAVRQTLNDEVSVNPRLLDRILNSRVGDIALEQIAQAIYTSSREANNAAMRSALILSASDDSRVSLIEVIENYPTPQVYVDGDRLVAAYQQVSALGSRLSDLLEGTGLF
jgi:hypothetical protein